MKHKVDPALLSLLVDVDTLIPLPGNPRKGNVDAIMASYAEFGQVKPIVVRPNGDGTSTVIAGNHQLMAAQTLGWTHIAVVPFEVDVNRAIAFALTDNRTNELGHSDQELVSEMLDDIISDYSDLMSDLGWDEMELAAIDESIQYNSPTTSDSDGNMYVPPVLQPLSDFGATILSSLVREDDDGERRIVAPEHMDHNEIAIKGSTVATPEAAPRAVVQYTIVFDDPDQQRRWYEFIRWIRSQPAYDGTTTSEKLISFIDAHSEI
jgi:hypothetical protein